MYTSSQNVNEQIIINEGPLKVTCFFKNNMNVGFFGFSHLACRTLYIKAYLANLPNLTTTWDGKCNKTLLKFYLCCHEIYGALYLIYVALHSLSFSHFLTFV
jgi:hypothetical protein